ncbi:MAG: hypothetical protein JST22_05195 [Bacteroidetes bacterium]|nr:hypothetical protein [Bacteroidota bacterium]
MSFDTFISNAWNDHGNHPEEVADRLANSLGTIETAADIPRFAGLVTHVYGEHLGRWSDGRVLLESLRNHPAWDGGPAVTASVTRGIAVLDYAGGANISLDHLAVDDRIAVLATASTAFVGQGNFRKAIAAYAQATELAEPGLPPGSPALRSLAVGGNNLAAALEEKSNRDDVESAGMVEAARGGLKYWKLAGTWLEEERAEYRLARSLMQAGDYHAAVESAGRCVEVCDAHQAPAFELFFGHAVLALAQRGAGNQEAFQAERHSALEQYALVSEDDRVWCAGDLKELGD